MKANNYIVCSTVRSGSTLLCKTLAQLTGCGQPKEYFHRHTIERLQLDNNPERFLSYCQEIVQESALSQSAFGMKMHWHQLLDCLRLARQSSELSHCSDLEIINALFPKVTFIYLRRRDVIAQAVSAAIATQTGRWEKPTHRPEPASTTPIKFQPWRIYEWDQALRSQYQLWQQFFSTYQLPHYEITYEDLVANFPTEISNILSYINYPSNAFSQEFSQGLSIPTKRQGNQTNQKFIRYYTLLPRPVSAMIFRLYEKVVPLIRPSSEPTAEANAS
ncbi:MAG: Stf0 family sulfotransferase [Cyanobacteria bacterium J06631_9]